MTRLFSIVATSLVALFICCTAPNFAQAELGGDAQGQLALYYVDVTLVDAETGDPIKPPLQLEPPDDFLYMPGPNKLIRRPASTELDPGSGRCRIIWVGIPREKHVFRLSAPGYEPIEIPTQLIEEIKWSLTIGGTRTPRPLSMQRSERETKD